MINPEVLAQIAQEYRQMHQENARLNEYVISLRNERDELQRLLEQERAEVRRLSFQNTLNIN